MARLAFVELPPFALMGTTIQGVLELDLDKPVSTRDITLVLTGREHAQVTVQAGKNSQTIVDERPFLEQGVSLRDRVPFADPEHALPGSYRIPFTFQLPPVSPPTLETTALTATRGRLEGFPDGMYVEYELTARLAIPWWIDPIQKVFVAVYPPVRFLGAFTGGASPTAPDHVGVAVTPKDPAAAWIVPGRPFGVRYRISNPGGRQLKDLTLQLVRLVTYRCRAYTRQVRTVCGSFPQTVEGNAPVYEGELDLMVPVGEEMVNPGTGMLFQVGWELDVDLGVHLGFGVKFALPLMLPSTSPPGAPPPG